MRSAPLLDPPVRTTFPPIQPARQPSEPITVWLMDEPECEPYERFVATCPSAGLYHTLAWRDAARLGDGGTPSYLAALRGERVVGVLPLVEQCDLWGRRRLISLPETPACGPVAEDAAVEVALMDKAAEYARARGAAALVIRRFAATDKRAPQVAAGGWLRVPARVVFAMADDFSNGAAPDVQDQTAADVQDQAADLQDRPVAEPGDPAAAIVQALRRRGIRAGVSSTDGGCRIAWACYGSTLHVLSMDGVPSPGIQLPSPGLQAGLPADARLATIAAIARREQSAGAAVRWIDLPPVRAGGPLLRQLARQALPVVEERIPVPKGATLLRRAARSISMALTG